MGESGDTVKGKASSDKNRQIFYASGVDKLAIFVDKHQTEIRVCLLYQKLLFLNFLYASEGIIAHPYSKGRSCEVGTVDVA